MARISKVKKNAIPAFPFYVALTDNRHAVIHSEAEARAWEHLGAVSAAQDSRRPYSEADSWGRWTYNYAGPDGSIWPVQRAEEVAL